MTSRFLPLRSRRVWFGGALALVFALLIDPALLWAHARLSKSEPGAASVLTTPPREIRLWFTERPELGMTKVTLADSAGVPVALGAVAKDSASAFDVRIPVTGAARGGRYTVAWQTVSVDGHPIRGEFTFRVTDALPDSVVGAPAMPTIQADAPPSVVPEMPMPTAQSPAYAAARALSYAALVVLIGAVAFRFLVVRGPLADEASRAEVGRRLVTFASAAAVVFLLAACVRLLLQGRMLADGGSTDWQAVLATAWGRAWVGQAGTAVVVLGGYLAARAGIRAGWILAALGTVALPFFVVTGGHAGAAKEMRLFSIADAALHIIGAGGWLGTLLCVIVIGVPAAMVLGDARHRRVSDLVHAFSPVAMGFAGLLVLTGVISLKFKLGTWGVLTTSSYGQFFLIKLALFVAIAAAGAFNWRRVRPSLGTEPASARLQRSASIELGLGVLVIIATAILVAMPTPA